MANFLGKIKNMLNPEDYDEYDDEIDDVEEEEVAPKVNIPRTSNVTSFDQYSSDRYPRRPVQQSKVINTRVQVEVVVASPTNLEDAASICLDLRAKKATVVNLEDVDFEMAQRISDFLSGAAYALEGKMQLISDRILIIGPVNVDITGEFKDELRASGIKLPTGVWK